MTEKQRLEINHLLELNYSGSIRFDEMTKLLSYMEKYWTTTKILQTSDEASVFKAFMEQAWQEAVAGDDTKIMGQEAKDANKLDANIDWDHMYQKIIAADAMSGSARAEPLDHFEEEMPFSSKKVGVRTMLALRWIAAAILVILVGISGWWFTTRHVVGTRVALHEAKQDLQAPSSAKAILILADGRQIALDGSGNGVVASQQEVNVQLNGNNSLAYNQVAGSVKGKIQYNELRILNGSQPVSVRLSDGSKVWLNVGSSLRYPTVFESGSREVTLNGEAYFEVRHETRRPFIVRHGNMSVKVLGTHFNINSYTDEPSMKITLLQGSVEVDRHNQHLLLQPGQQAIVPHSTSGSLILNKQVDLDQVLSWKSAEFVFTPGTDFKAIMRQIARWYNVQISYAGSVKTKFWGSVPRTASIQEVLKLLEATGGVRFELSERQLKVIPVK